ncbi:hypothetical protein HN954_02515 [bacterium]|nr:hypothetical protein [bacterium]MBT6831633.1 hypothetical protein [bacterium]MBT6996279.1 hypothetical protein [bacterium]MBT7772957.1 hypothetical protein [bacterium]
MKKSKIMASKESMLLSKEIFKNRSTQVVTSILLVVVLGIQVYLFLTVNQIMQEALAANMF